jgi:TrmH family RNA methyltransferase
MKAITKNQIKYALKIKNNSNFRRKENKVFIEGEHNVLELIKNKPNIVEQIFKNETYQGDSTLNNFNEKTFIVSKLQAKKISFGKKAFSLAAVVNLSGFDNLQKPDFTKGVYIGLVNVQDPFNVGTIFRTAEAFGVSGVILFDGCVNPFNQKVVISSTGSVFRVPFYTIDSAVEFMLKSKDTNFFGTSVEDATDYNQVKIDNGIILFGNEGNGLSEKILSKAKQNIYIPIKTDSLNIGVSVGVIISKVLGNE